MEACLSDVGLSRLIEANGEPVLRRRLIGVYHVDKFFTSQRVEDVCSFGSDLKHGPGRIVIWLHASEIPSAKFVEVNDTILVKIKVIKCPFELLRGEWMAELG